MRRTFSLFSLCAFAACRATGAPTVEKAAIVALPAGGPGIGFDDLKYAPGLMRVLVPAGRTGNLDLVDPLTREVTSISGFGKRQRYEGGHDESVTSADEGDHLLFATDRTSQELVVADPLQRAIVARAKLSASPDYVRYISFLQEVWITEPDHEQIEVFSLTPQHGIVRKLAFAVPGGPESLVFDSTRERAYTHSWKGRSAEIDARRHEISHWWPNGCRDSRGIAIDERRGLLFAGCEEGRAVAMDVKNVGKRLSSLSTGRGVDVMGYDAGLAHLYVPEATLGTMDILNVDAKGHLSLLGSAKTSPSAHCATADGHGGIWVCDPSQGHLLFYRDPFPPGGR